MFKAIREVIAVGNKVYLKPVGYGKSGFLKGPTVWSR